MCIAHSSTHLHPLDASCRQAEPPNTYPKFPLAFKNLHLDLHQRVPYLGDLQFRGAVFEFLFPDITAHQCPAFEYPIPADMHRWGRSELDHGSDRSQGTSAVDYTCVHHAVVYRTPANGRCEP